MEKVLKLFGSDFWAFIFVKEWRVKCLSGIDRKIEVFLNLTVYERKWIAFIKMLSAILGRQKTQNN
jgi:hypothetical protein